MARTLRIDNVTTQAGGGVSIGVTASNGVLPDSPSKNAFSFKSKAELIAAMQAFESGLTDEQLLLLLIAIAYKQDATLGATAAAALVGKTVALSLTSGAQLVKIT